MGETGKSGIHKIDGIHDIAKVDGTELIGRLDIIVGE